MMVQGVHVKSDCGATSPEYVATLKIEMKPGVWERRVYYVDQHAEKNSVTWITHRIKKTIFVSPDSARRKINRKLRKGFRIKQLGKNVSSHTYEPVQTQATLAK